jgi:hypothetical protein
VLKFFILCIVTAVLFAVSFPSPAPAGAQQPASGTFGALALETGKANFGAYIYDDDHELRRPAQAEIVTLQSDSVNPPASRYDGPHGGSDTVSGR